MAQTINVITLDRDKATHAQSMTIPFGVLFVVIYKF